MLSYGVSLICLFCACTQAWAQVDAERLLESLTDAEADPTALLETLEHLADHPLALNTAPAEALAQIPMLGHRHAVALVRFRDTFGPFKHLTDMLAVEGITQALFTSIRPYLILNTPEPERTAEAPRKPLRFRLRQRYARRLTLGRGYTDTTRTTYLGTPGRVYTRLQVDHPRLRLNLTAEKDPAEPFAWAPGTRTFGFDFTSAHAAVHNLGRLKTLILGDYAVAFGQGLVFWRNSGFGKGRDPVRPIVRSGAGLIPYGSSNENAFFRGIANTVALTRTLSLTALASRRTLDATRDTAGFIRTLGTSGLHRTPAEVNRKDQLLETLIGGALTFHTQRLHAGLTGYRNRFDMPLAFRDAPVSSMRMVGIYGTMVTGPLTWFGEGATNSKGYAGIGGVQVQADKTLEAVFLVRHYPQPFSSLHGYGFGERNGKMHNETGWYLGLKLRLPGPWHMAAYMDQFHFSDAGNPSPRPGTGYETLAVVEYDPPGNRTSAYLQVRHETKSTPAVHANVRGVLFRGVQSKTRQSVRLHGSWQPEPRLRFRGRIEGTRSVEAAMPSETGFLLYQEVRWQLHPRLWTEGRITFFDTSAFDARVYAFENDVRYVLTNPALSGQGQRTYLLLQYTPTRHLTFWLKWAETQYEKVRSVGSGLDEAPGNRLRDIRVQVQWTW